MIDAPGRAPPRFPAAMEPVAATRIEEALELFSAGASDVALTQGASGGDLLFAEACARRGVPLQLLLPLREPEFIAQSILPSADGAQWKQRYLDLKATLGWPPRALPDELGLAQGEDPFERCNLWLLNTALACGAEKVRLICLWNGGGGDGPGGTAHMVREVQRHQGQVLWLDTRSMW